MYANPDGALYLRLHQTVGRKRGNELVIKEGDSVPKFSLQADDGTTVTLDSFANKNVVLFFYPKDNTSG